MKRSILSTITFLAAGSLLAADSPSDQVSHAISQLAAAPNYTWTMTVNLAGAPYQPGLLTGHADKDGYAVISQPLGGVSLEAVFKGEKVALKTDIGWQLPNPSDPRAMAMGGLITRYGTAVHEAETLFKAAVNLRPLEGGLFAGDLTEEVARQAFAPPPGVPAPPPPRSPSGSVKFWVKDGLLTKFESQVRASVQVNASGVLRQAGITRTIEISQVGITRVEVPAEARQKLEP